MLNIAEQGLEKNGNLARTRLTSAEVVIFNFYPGVGWYGAGKKTEAYIYFPIFTALLATTIAYQTEVFNAGNAKREFRQNARLLALFLDSNSRIPLVYQSYQMQAQEQAAKEKFNGAYNWTVLFWFASFAHSSIWSLSNSEREIKPATIGVSFSMKLDFNAQP